MKKANGVKENAKVIGIADNKEITESKEIAVITTEEKQGLAFVEPKDLEEEEMLVAKIMTLKEYTEKIVIQSSIEMGAYLARAKSLMKHGQWGNWLKERVAFSHRTANNLMNIYEKYGQGELANSQAISNLSLTQAINLLAVPDDQLEEFIEKNNALELSSRELEKKVQEMKEQNEIAGRAVSELKEKEKDLAEANESKQKEIDKLQDTISKLEEEQKLAEESKDADVQKPTDEAVRAEKEKLAQLEEEKSKLQKDLSNNQQEQKKAIETAVKEAEERTKNELARKHDKEIEQMKTQLEAAILDIKSANEKADQAEKYYKVSGDLQRFSILNEHMESTFNEMSKILISLEKNDNQSGIKLKKSFENVLESMVAKLKITVATPQGKIS